MPETKKFGNLLAVTRGAHTPDRFDTIADMMFDKLYKGLDTNLSRWTDPRGNMLASPVVFISPEPRGLMIDIHTAVVPSVEHMAWIVGANTNGLKERLRSGIRHALDLWWAESYRESIVIDDKETRNIKALHG